MTELQYLIGLSLVPKIGGRRAKDLIEYFGSAEEVFKQDPDRFLELSSFGKGLVNNFKSGDFLKKAEEVIKNISTHNITPLTYKDSEYPYRLKRCYDCPLVIYFKGKMNMNPHKIISIVGTRSVTKNGIDNTHKIISDLTNLGHIFTVVSGFALGVDIESHLSAIENNQETIAILGHELNSIYPPQNAKYVNKINNNGGFISEYRYFDEFRRENFIARNRIIAGISDCTIVIESGERGGSLITADFSNSYNRDVFSIPGRINDKFSVGCNNLIKYNKAVLINSAKDIEKFMGWDKEKSPTVKSIKLELFSTEEQLILTLLQNKSLSYNELLRSSIFTQNKLTKILIELELNNIINFIPGNYYELK